MKKSIKLAFDVSRRDIQQARRDDCDQCPMELAIARALKREKTMKNFRDLQGEPPTDYRVWVGFEKMAIHVNTPVHLPSFPAGTYKYGIIMAGALSAPIKKFIRTFDQELAVKPGKFAINLEVR